jgi:hypothetical protein
VYHPIIGSSFDVYTDASDAVGAALVQDGLQVAYFPRKLTGAQVNYTVSEKEALAIVWYLNTYRHLFYGAPLTIYVHRSF